MLKRIRKIQQYGNALGLQLTEHLKELGLAKGDSVNVEIIKDKIVISKEVK